MPPWKTKRQKEDEAAKAYGIGYVTWEKPPLQLDMSGRLDSYVVKEVFASKQLSTAEQSQLDAFLPKFKIMMSKAFKLGRYDANRRPCPFAAVSSKRMP